MKKQTSVIIVHFVFPDMKFADEWFIENHDGDYTIQFFNASNHESWLGRFDCNRRQYDFYCIAMTRDECEAVCKLVAGLREAEPPAPAAENGKRGRQHRYHHLMIELKDRGMGNKEIASLLNTTEDSVKKFFYRLAKKYRVKGFHAVIRHALAQQNF